MAPPSSEKRAASEPEAKSSKRGGAADSLIVHPDPIPASVDVPCESDAKAAFDQCVDQASTVPEGVAVPCKVDTLLVHHNVKHGVLAIRSVSGRVRDELPRTDLDRLSQIENLALALVHASRVVDEQAGGENRIRELVSRAARLRAVMFPAAESLAHSDLLPTEAAVEVERIRKGSGFPDLAQDLIDLAAFFRRYSTQTAGRTTVTAELVDEAEKAGKTLLAELEPKSWRNPGATEPDALTRAALVRDQLWTLLLRRHEELWRVGAYLFGRDHLDIEVPELLARPDRPTFKRPAP